MHGVTTESQGAKAPLAGAGELRVLLTADQIASRVRALGLEIARDYDGERPLLVAVLKGACMFLADLARTATGANDFGDSPASGLPPAQHRIFERRARAPRQGSGRRRGAPAQPYRRATRHRR